jgi:hypothetical protein
MRLLRKRLKYLGAVKRGSPFPVADSSETTPRLGRRSVWLRLEACIRIAGMKIRRLKKQELKAYLTIIMFCFFVAAAIHALIAEKGKEDGQRELNVDIEGIQKILGDRVDQETLEKLRRGKVDAKDIERLKETYAGKMNEADRKKLKEILERFKSRGRFPDNN